MRLPLMTTRRWMLVVVGVALVTWPSTVAWRISADRRTRYIYHIWVRKDSPYDEPDRPMTGTLCYAPFWSRYRRALLGQPWPGTYKCRCDDPRYRVSGGVSQFYSIVGSRAGPDPRIRSLGGFSPRDDVDSWDSLLREYYRAHKDRPAL
jgi:hypothetical protein